MAKEFEPPHPDVTEITPPFSQDVHDFLLLEQLRRELDATNNTRNSLWLVQETLIHRMKRDERRQVFARLAALRQQRSPTSSPGKEASRA